MKSIFRQGDRVYHFLYGWGDVIQIVTNNNYLWVRVQFDDKPKDFQDNFKDGFLLSFTKYKLEGFSKERPEESPNKGDIVWIREMETKMYVPIVFIEAIKDHYVLSFNFIDIKTVHKDFVETKNPYI
jgi:hypothetical protein